MPPFEPNTWTPIIACLSYYLIVRVLIYVVLMINMGAELACSFRRMFGRIFFLKESMAAQMFRPEYDQVSLF